MKKRRLQITEDTNKSFKQFSLRMKYLKLILKTLRILPTILSKKPSQLGFSRGSSMIGRPWLRININILFSAAIEKVVTQF